MISFAVIGYGGRGRLYAEILKNKAPVAAVCDVDPVKRALAKKELNLREDRLYDTDAGFFGAGKLADVLVVATQDALHAGHAMKGLELGYDLLLEKPVACSTEDCETLERTALALGRNVFVCHVLRYAPFFSRIKRELASGKYGKVAAIDLTENVGYWHQAHSYVRGNSRRADLGTPMILAKCCHDLDLICWYADAACRKVGSFGSLGYYTRENAPAGSADYCLDCVREPDCPYSAKKLYVEQRAAKGLLQWPCNAVVPEPTVEKLLAALKTSPFGRCVYKCDNNVVDRQTVGIEFENGITAHLTMTAFSADCFREIRVHCEKGELYGDMRENVLHTRIFGGESADIALHNETDTSYGHGGGDVNMIADILDFYDGKRSDRLTTLARSMQSHYIGFAAERSRLSGKIVSLRV